MSLNLKPVFNITLNLEEPKTVATNSAGVHNIASIKSGTTKSFSEDFPFNSTVYGGRDDITVSPKGSHFNLDCKVFGTLEDGTGYFIKYYGVVRLDKAVTDVIGKQSKEHSFEDGYLVNQIFVTLDKDSDKKYDWIEKHVLVGRGRFFRNDDGALNIEYNVSAVTE
ncbi:hypothetical protein DV495_002879 [Geotrichum candidum]|nr:hypothetical protein DV452_002064 [Geotrichum candidum]KAF5128817.1 hypothetical protein DV495_002879 [Geotrichum candidum]KAI8134183.1 hypothetical protein DUD61_002157 [Geotrichum candidum]KAI9211385.1 hypothetical protein DS838_003747 [Geotrichum bryndzae]